MNTTAPTTTPEPTVLADANNKVLILRTCKADMAPEYEKANGVVYPSNGWVEAPDWDPRPQCGNGLHGLLWAQGNYSLLSAKRDAKYLIIEADAKDVVSIDHEKVKFRGGNVVAVFDRWWQAFAYILPKRPKVVTDKIATGDSGHAAATGNSGHAAATGNYGHAAATGNSGHAAATGDSGHAAATGNYGHAACLASGGRAKAGPNGLVALVWNDGARGRMVVGYVGEDGIEADTWYVVKDGKLVID